MKKMILLASLVLPLASAQEFKIAVVGLVHSHVWGHLGVMVKGDPAKLVGVAEKNPDLVAEAKKAGVADNLIFDDYKKMLDETKPDIVWAFVENNRHLEVAKACAIRKINIMFEKPLASTYKEAAEIRDLAKKSGIHVLTNYQMAWWASNYTAKALADSGELGSVYRVRGIVGHGGPSSEGPRNKVFFDWLTDPVKNGAGALMDFGCYNALWSLWYFGRPETVYATVQHIRPERFPKVEDNATLVLAYPKFSGVFEGSWDLPRSYQDLEIFGSKGERLYDQRQSRSENGPHTCRRSRDQAAMPENAEPIAYMIQAIKTGKALDGMVGLDINVQVIEIIDAAKESVKTGKALKLAVR